MYLGPKWPPFLYWAKRMCIRLMSLGRTSAPGPSRIASSCVCSLRIRCARDGIVESCICYRAVDRSIIAVLPYFYALTAISTFT